MPDDAPGVVQVTAIPRPLDDDVACEPRASRYTLACEAVGVAWTAYGEPSPAEPAPQTAPQQGGHGGESSRNFALPLPSPTRKAGGIDEVIGVGQSRAEVRSTAGKPPWKVPTGTRGISSG